MDSNGRSLTPSCAFPPPSLGGGPNDRSSRRQWLAVSIVVDLHERCDHRCGGSTGFSPVSRTPWLQREPLSGAGGEGVNRQTGVALAATQGRSGGVIQGEKSEGEQRVSQRLRLRLCQIRQRPHGAGVVEVTVWPVGDVCSMEARATEASSLETGSQASVSRETGTDRRDSLTSGWRGCRRELPSCPSARYHRDGSVPSAPGPPSGWRRRTGWRSRTVRR